MAATINKQRLLTQLFTLLKKAQGVAETEPRPVLEQFIYALCHENTSREMADRAYKNLREVFVDWNEVRVSSVRELEEAMAGLPEAEVRAERVISFLQEVFETTFSYDLEPLHKKGVKQACKALARFQAANDYVCSWVVQHSLGGHAIPLDAPTLRTVRRLGLVDVDQDDREAVRTSLEHLIPKAKGPLFTELISYTAQEFCWEEQPHCSDCPLCAECPTGQTLATDEVAMARTSRSKPR